jgi:MFS transporter, PAT family, beta-lactamase induction signal transducer AmpG
VSLQSISFAGVLAAPWMAKALWAPWVDRFGNAAFGRRKSWIVPMQLGLVMCALIASRSEQTELLLALVFFMNLFAATQDIAVDGLAVSWIRPGDLGIANAFQVVGYKLGMLTGGGLLLWASARIGYRGMFEVMAVLIAIVMIVAIFTRENRSSAEPDAQPTDPLTLRDIWHLLKEALRSRATLPLIAVVLTYKAGETLADGMWKPMLFDRGFASADIGMWNGTYGMIASFIGSLLGGLWIRAHPIPAALFGTAALRAIGVGAEWWVSVAQVGAAGIIVVTCIEHLLSGAITTVLFALMMRHTRREIGGTHYTLLASLEVLGKGMLGFFSGAIAQRLGYATLFAIATALSLAFAAFAYAMRAPLTAAEDEATAT